jgi:hypothetical protein
MSCEESLEITVRIVFIIIIQITERDFHVAWHATQLSHDWL